MFAEILERGDNIKKKPNEARNKNSLMITQVSQSCVEEKTPKLSVENIDHSLQTDFLV